MQEIRIAICDDEPVFAEKLSAIVQGYCEKKQIIFEIDRYHSGKELVADPIRLLQYRIIFLDISMEEMDGLETARELRKLSKKIFLIFVTAFLNYTLDGYKVDALRYLLKADPFLERSVEESLDAVFHEMAYKPRIENFAFVEGDRNLSLENIIYIESRLHKLNFYIYEEEIVVYTLYETLNHICGLFSSNFIRAHQSYLVNLRFVKRMDKHFLMLSQDIFIPVSRKYEKEVKKQLARYKGEI